MIHLFNYFHQIDMKRFFTFGGLLLGLMLTSNSILWAQSKESNRTIVLEKFTASWCGLCPEGRVTYDQLNQDFPDNLFGVNIHVNDPMTIPTSEELSRTYTGGGVNSFLIDRFRFPDLQFVQFSFEYEPLKEKISERLAEKAAVDIAFETINFDKESRELSVSLSANFHEQITDQQFSWNLWIVEDSVWKDVPGYPQVNYFNTYEDHQYKGAGNPIPDYVHRNVLRKALGGAWGTENSLPETIEANQAYTYEYKATLSDEWNPQQIKLVAIVQTNAEEWKDRNILNASVSSLIEQKAEEEENPNGEENPDENTNGEENPEENPNGEENPGENTNGEENPDENPNGEENPDDENNTSTAIDDWKEDKQIVAYPNPVQDQLILELFIDKAEHTTIILVNMLGERTQLYSRPLSTGKHTISWNRRQHQLEAGLYFLQIETPKQKQVLKLILAD